MKIVDQGVTAMEKSAVHSYIVQQEAYFAKLSDGIWDAAETAFQETASAAILCKALEENGFAVQRKAAGIDTAFCGTFGHGKPVIGFLGEFDALSGLSQCAGADARIPVQEGANGHGCGHNLLGVGCLAAAVGMKRYLEETGREGTVVYYGCPAEEGGSGKAFMAREGLFDDLDAAISWHPGTSFGASGAGMLGNCQVYFHFTGISSHAGMTPHLGRSALDAVELMNVGVQFLREHIPTSGGLSPNVVQPKADVLYLLRAPDNDMLADVYQRVQRIAKGAAMMTDTEVEIDFVKACSNVVPNDTLGYAVVENLRQIPKPEFASDDLAFYSRISATNRDGSPENPVNLAIADYMPSDKIFGASSDVGDVSWVVPTVSVSAPAWPAGTDAHSWQAVSVGKSGIAHAITVSAGQAMAGLAIDLMEDPALLEKAKAEHRKRLKGRKYECPIPKGVKPRIIK